MNQSSKITLSMNYDHKAGAWFVESCTVPGLHLEAKTLAGLLLEMSEALPVLITLNTSEQE